MISAVANSATASAAMYLAAKNKRAFLSPLNWMAPYKGVSQAVIQRAISGGLYFPLESLFINNVGELVSLCACEVAARRGTSLCESKRNNIASGVGGQSAGIAVGICLHPLAWAKYRIWGHEDSPGVLQTIKREYAKGGIRGLSRGMGSTVTRDAIFGTIFSTIRHSEVAQFRLNNSIDKVEDGFRLLMGALRRYGGGQRAPSTLSTAVQAEREWVVSPATAVRGSASSATPVEPVGAHSVRDATTARHHTSDRGPTRVFFVNTVSACAAVITSSPYNYVRNMKFASTGATAPSTGRILANCVSEAAEIGRQVAARTAAGGGASGMLLRWSVASCVVASRFHVGWGTLRVALGMAFSASVYDACK
eukprot:GHVU01070935.1.p1 GENE.GHVU01070935.1~~GHVU01070935.1.p1  ORF type:complete len:365 (+),score=21.39 GHVU01070935.1:269-1363(+)